MVVLDRYRIVALIGRGGMGEVYRAEDLTLSQTVAIKFLPESLFQDPVSLERFYTEVRIARQVSHPNICRVFDIGQVDGVPFITMEYVDGEDLASLVRRIGRVSPDKAVEIARQICAGLAAAHDRGVVHRDLKPSNIMLDGSGKVRVMDFGLAGIAALIRGAEVCAGTPAYMAPEQLAGKEVTPKSDIYSLGLVLYEVLTAKRAYDAGTLPELVRLREQSAPTNPSTLVRDLDPLLERVILRCLEKDPLLRPATALQVAAALPGGDPLAAALAAGETPSPEMVAAAGRVEGMRPRLAMGLLALVIVGLIVFVFVADRYKLSNLAALDHPPEVLVAKARELVKAFGYPEQPADSDHGFGTYGSYLSDIERHDAKVDRWKVLRRDPPSAFLFWYRQSPRYLVPRGFFSGGPTGGKVDPSDPPMNLSGMVFVLLDPKGRLQEFEAVPPQKDPPKPPVPAPDWQVLFSAAGLDAARFISAEPEWTPLAWGDARAAWTGTLAERPEIPVRVEAAAYRGKPIYFEIVYPWDTPNRMPGGSPSAQDLISTVALLLFFFTTLVGGAVVAGINLRAGRGDTRGARRVGMIVFLLCMLMWICRANHIPNLAEFNLFLIALSWALLATGLVMLVYLALEPYIRRREPHTLIAWSRVIGGQLRDPLVGRDVLVGVVFGVWLAMFESCDNILLPLIGLKPPRPGVLATESLLGMRLAIGSVLLYTLIYILYALAIFFGISMLRVGLRKEWLATGLFLLISGLSNYGGEYPWLNVLFVSIIFLFLILILKRFGLVALIVGLVVQNLLVVFPATTHLAQWYATSGLFALLTILALAFYGFHSALAGQSLFAASPLDE
jgi:serine/threonine-protein kinase